MWGINIQSLPVFFPNQFRNIKNNVKMFKTNSHINYLVCKAVTVLWLATLKVYTFSIDHTVHCFSPIHTHLSSSSSILMRATIGPWWHICRWDYGCHSHDSTWAPPMSQRRSSPVNLQEVPGGLDTTQFDWVNETIHISVFKLTYQDSMIQMAKMTYILPRTTSLAEAEALSTTVWAVQVYIPAWLSWAFTINRSPMFSFWKGTDTAIQRTVQMS